MLAVGYSDQSNAFIVRNSWGQDWVNKIFFSQEMNSFNLTLG
jgi:C1A family cysteine protease